MKKAFHILVQSLALLLLTSCGSSIIRETTPITVLPGDATDQSVRATQPSKPPDPPSNANTSSGINLDLKPEAPKTWAPAIDSFLIQGGIDALKVEMEKIAEAPNWHLDLIDDELAGNEQTDLRIGLSTLDLENMTTHSIILLIQCDPDQCEITHQRLYDSAAASPPQLSAQDFNNDGMTDLLVSIRECGAHTCFLEIEALTWREGSMRNMFPGPTDDLPNPELKLDGPLENGRFMIEITATGISSVGAGPFRQFTRSWIWSDEEDQFVQVKDIYRDPEYRIHQIHDADELFASAQLEAASAAFLKVVQDGELSDWISDPSNLSAYAYYRIGLITLLMDGELTTRTPFTQLLQAFPPGTEGSAYSDLAEVFWDTYIEDQDWPSACHNAIEYARQNSQTILEPLYYGYANKAYSAEDMCPFGG